MLLEEGVLSAWVDLLRRGNFAGCNTEDGVAMGLNLAFSLYFFEHPTVQKREYVYGLCDRFNDLINHEFRLVYFGRGGVHKLGSKHGQLRGKKENNDQEETFFLNLASALKAEDSPAYYLDSTIRREDHQRVADLANPKYSYLRIGVRAEWFAGDKRDALLELIAEAAEALGAHQGYGGFGWALPMSNHAFPDFEATEHYFAHQFYGLDIDKPFYMCSGHNEVWSLEKGLRAPSWLTFVGDEWLAKLGGAPVVTERLLAHPEVQVHPYVGGLIVQAGESPDLYPVEDGVPEVMTHVATILKPVRAQTLNLLSYARFDGDEELDEVFFDLDKCSRWLGRYDADSDWPSADRRKPRPSVASSTPERRKLRGRAGETVPVTGLWWSPALRGKDAKRVLAAGDNFPETISAEYGEVIWYLMSAETA